MALTVVSRRAAGLPAVPSAVGYRSITSWTGIKVHHTGGAFSSWRGIYDWQVLNRPKRQRLIDVGYSFGVADGRVTELRGWNRHPAHDHENSTIGVVFGGNYTNRLPPEEDLAAFVDFCRLAREKTGKRLAITGHRDTWPRGDWRYSTCPGDRLYAYLPTLRARVDRDEEDDMDLTDDVVMTDSKGERYSFGEVAKRDRIKVRGALGCATGAHYGIQWQVLPELEKAEARDRAILAALDSEGTDAILARIDEHAAVAQAQREAQAQRFEAALAGLPGQLGPLLVAELRAAAADLPEEAADAVAATVQGAVERALARVELTIGDDAA